MIMRGGEDEERVRNIALLNAQTTLRDKGFCCR